MTDKNNTKWSYIFRSSMRDFVLMAMITISLISILVVTNISNEQNEYIIKLEQREQQQEDQEDKETSQARNDIKERLAHLDRDIGLINHTTTNLKTILDRLLLFEEQIHNENIIKFQKLDKLQSDDEIKFNKLDNITNFMIEESKILEGKLNDILLQIQKNIDGSLDIINNKIDVLANSTK